MQNKTGFEKLKFIKLRYSKIFLLWSICQFILHPGNAQQADNASTINTLLWKISGKGLTRPSYLFGTCHLICEEDAQKLLTDGVKRAISSCDEMVFEINIGNAAEMVVSTLKYSKMNGDTTLNMLLGKGELDTVNNYFEKHADLGFPRNFVLTYKPCIVQSVINKGLLSCKTYSKMEEELQWVGVIYQKRISGLSSFKEQAGYMDSIPYRQQAKDLLRAIDKLNNLTADNNDYMKTLSLYKQQKSAELDKILKSSGDDRFTKIIGEARNRLWMPRLEEKLKDGSLFVAVGFAHLFGDAGLIQLLRDKGYTVEGVKNI